MGKIGVFVILFAAVFSLAITPTFFDNSFAGTIAAPPTPEICNDGVDNDGDGLIDGADPDCIFVALVPVPGALPELPGFPDDPDPNEDPLLGDFKCYIVSPGEFLGKNVILSDQFEQDRDFFTHGILEFCNYVEKQPSVDPEYPGSIIPDVPRQHYKVFDIMCDPRTLPRGEVCPGPLMEDVLLKDQWGTTRHMLLEPVELWVPQEKCHDLDINFECEPNQGDDVFPIQDTDGVPGLTPKDQIHWKCYDFEPIEGETFGVNLLDQFGPTTHEVFELQKICTPVEKTVLECPPGTAEYIPGECMPVTGGDPEPAIPVTYGDRTINDHLKCYSISDSDTNFDPPTFPVIYEGQFSIDFLFEPIEHEVCLVANKIHVPESAIGGSFIPIDSTSLLLVASYTTASWLIPVIVTAAGIGIVLTRKISSKKE